MRSYKFLLFDADGTLYDFQTAEKIALNSFFLHCNIPPSEENLALYKRANDRCWKEYEKGEISMERLKSRRFEEFLSEAGLDLDPYQAGRIYIKYLGEAGIMIDGAREVLKALKDHYHLVLITNGISVVQRQRLINSGTEGEYEKIIISEEIGYGKPDPEFFRITLDTIGATAEECLIIGDSLTSDIAGGVRSGIDTLYLHLDKDIGTEEPIWTYEAGSYESLLSCLLK